MADDDVVVSDERHTEIFISVKDAREAGCGFTEEEIASARYRFKTDGDIILIHADDLQRVQKLKTLHKKTRDYSPEQPVFFDMQQTPFTHVNNETNDRINFFRIWRGYGSSDERKLTPAESEKHKEACSMIQRLASGSNLKTVTCCTYHGHVPLVRKWPGWVPAEHRAKCIDAYAVPGEAQGATTKLSQRWEPQGSARRRNHYVFDAATKIDTDLVCAHEVQISHANSPSKIFDTGREGVKLLQYNGREVESKCRGRDWDDPDAPDVVLHNHPVDAGFSWICPACEPMLAAEVARAKRLEEEEAKEARERDAFEAPLLTSFHQLEPGKWVKGFFRRLPLSDEELKSKKAELEKERYDEMETSKQYGYSCDFSINHLTEQIEELEKKLRQKTKLVFFDQTRQDWKLNPNPPSFCLDMKKDFFKEKIWPRVMKDWYQEGVCIKIPRYRRKWGDKTIFYVDFHSNMIARGPHLPGFAEHKRKKRKAEAEAKASDGGPSSAGGV